MGMEYVGNIVDVDGDHKDPQLCATIACDIYNHLRMAEVIFGYKVWSILLHVTISHTVPLIIFHMQSLTSVPFIICD